MQFWLTFNNYEEKIQLPVNPSEFQIKTGKKNNVVDIVDLGEINIIGGNTLAEITISSFFPKVYASYMNFTTVFEPYDMINKLLSWKDSGKPIRLIVTETNINLPCSIESLEYGEKGGTRDVSFTLGLKEYRFITVKKVDEEVQERPNTRSVSGNYTIKDGDTIYSIAKKVTGDGANWNKIYADNIEIIGPDFNLLVVGVRLVISV